MSALFDTLDRGPPSVEYYLQKYGNSDKGPEGFTSEEALDNWRKAKEIIEERKRVAQIKADQERTAQIKASQDRIQYSDKLANEICERIASGELLTVICIEPSMPTARRVTQWLKVHQDFAGLYQQALMDRLRIFEDQMIEYADKLPTLVQKVTAKSTKEKIQFPDLVQRAKLQIEVRTRHLKAYKPERWGDATTITTKDASDGFDPASMSDEELEKKIADLEEKSR